MSTDRFRLAGGAFALLTGLLAAIAALALSNGGTNPATATPTGPPPAAAAFGVLRAQAAGGASPFANASRFAPGIATASVHSVHLGSGRYSVAATADRICTDSRRAGSTVSTGGCVSVAGAVADGFFTGSHAAPGGPDAGQVSITGLVPDGVRSVAVTLASGKTVVLGVQSNVVAATFDEQPVSGRFTKADGTVVVATLTEG